MGAHRGKQGETQVRVLRRLILRGWLPCRFIYILFAQCFFLSDQVGKVRVELPRAESPTIFLKPHCSLLLLATPSGPRLLFLYTFYVANSLHNFPADPVSVHLLFTNAGTWENDVALAMYLPSKDYYDGDCKAKIDLSKPLMWSLGRYISSEFASSVPLWKSYGQPSLIPT